MGAACGGWWCAHLVRVRVNETHPPPGCQSTCGHPPGVWIGLPVRAPSLWRSHVGDVDDDTKPQAGDCSGPSGEGYQLGWYRDVDIDPELADGDWGWTAQDYTLAYALGVDSNLEAQQMVIDELTSAANPLLERIGFDSERGCFFAYAATEADMAALVEFIAGMVARRHPAAIPGTITDSPAYLRRFDDLYDLHADG